MARAHVQDYGKLIELPVQRKLLSLLSGRHGGTGAGASHEFLDMAEYKVGDDIGDIDWKSSAKIRHPVVKRFEQTAVLNVILAVDTGSNMAALAPGPAPEADSATADGAAKHSRLSRTAPQRTPSPQSKADIAGELVGALGWLTAYRGDHLGLVAGNASGLSTLPARSGAVHAQTLLSVATAGEPTGAPGDFTAIMRRVDATRRGRALVIGITDAGQIDRMDPTYLKRVAMRHKLVMVLVQDADPSATPDGSGLRDVTSGPLPDFAQSDADVLYQWANSKQARQHRVTEKLRHYGIDWVAVSSVEEVPAALVALFGGGGRGARTA